MSFIRAAGMFDIKTDIEPFVTIPGPPGTQAASTHGMVWSVTRAAGKFWINTVGAPGLTIGSIIGGWGTGVGVGAGG